MLKPNDSVKPFLLLYISFKSNGLVFKNLEEALFTTSNPSFNLPSFVKAAVSKSSAIILADLTLVGTAFLDLSSLTYKSMFCTL